MLYTYTYHQNWKQYRIQWEHKRTAKQEKYQNQVLV